MIWRVMTMVVVVWGLAQPGRAQTSVYTVDRLGVGTSTVGTAPLRVGGLASRTSETQCLWIGASGDVVSGACGTVTSVGLAAPSELTVSGSPVTSGGTLMLGWANAPANSVFQRAGTSGPPSFSTSLTLGAHLTVNGNTTLGDATSDTVTLTGRLASGLRWSTDTTYDIGASGANRPRDLFLGRNATIGGTLGVTGATTLSSTLGVTGVATFGSTAQATGWTSRTSGWGITSDGDADVRQLFADELRAKAFTSELTQAVNGSMTWTKSVTEVTGESTVGGAVTCPTAGGAAETWWFRDAPGGANLRIFQADDYVSLRVLSWADTDANGASELQVSDCIVQVSSYADGTGGNDGHQSWSVTRPASGGGSMANGGSIPLRTQALNFGVSGNGLLFATVSDGPNNVNAPYFGAATWTTTPAAANWTTRLRLGQLRGITSTSEYGLLAGTYAATDGRFFRASDQHFDLHGIDLTIWDGAVQAIIARRNAGAPYLAVGNPAPTTYSSGTGVWMGDDGGTYKFRVGAPSGNRVTWDGSTLAVTGTVTATSGSIGGWTLGTTTLTGTNVVLDASGTIRAGTAGGARVDLAGTPALGWYDSSNTRLGQISSSGLLVAGIGSTTWTDSRAYRFEADGGGSSSLKAGMALLYDPAFSEGAKRVLLIEHGDPSTSKPPIQSLILHVGSDDIYSMHPAMAGNNSIELSRGVSTQDFIRLYSKSGSLFFDATLIRGFGNLSTTGKGLIGDDADFTGSRFEVRETAASGDPPLLINAQGRSNDTSHEIARWNTGTDGTLGALALVIAARPSATGSTRRVEIYAGDVGAYRQVLLQPYGGNVGIGVTSATYLLDVGGTVNATTYRVGGTVGQTATFNPTACTSMTFTSGILTARTGC